MPSASQCELTLAAVADERYSIRLPENVGLNCTLKFTKSWLPECVAVDAAPFKVHWLLLAPVAGLVAALTAWAASPLSGTRSQLGGVVLT